MDTLAATQTQDPSPDIASLSGGSPAIADLAGDNKKTLADLAQSKRKQVAEETKAFDEADRRTEHGIGQMQKYLDQEGVELKNAPPPWDADKEHKKFESDPIQGIGSVGSIFAVLASAFTKAPATNAIEGMAGAINAIKEGNESAYNRAYESYKQNIKLAMDREKVIHEQYQDAASLLSANMTAGDAKMRHIITKYGDQQVSTLWDAGYNKEAWEAIDARAKAASQLQELSDKNLEHHIRLTAYDTMKQPVPEGATPAQAAQVAAQNLNAWRTANNIKEAYNTPEQEVTARIIHENPKATGPELAQKLEEAGVKVGRQTERDKIIQERVYYEEQAIRDREGREPTAEESAKIRQDAAAMGHPSGGGGLTEPKLVAAEIKRRADENMAAGMDPSAAFDKAMKDVKADQQEGRGSLTKIDSAEVKRRIEELKKEHPDWTDDKIFDTARTTVAAARTGGLLDESARKVIAGQVKAGDNSGLVGLSPANKTAVRQEIADSLASDAKVVRSDLKKQHPDWDDAMLDDAAKISPDQLGKSLALASADYQGTRTALRTLATRSVAIKQAATEAKGFMEVARDAASRVPRTSSVTFNRLAQAAEGEFSDPDLKEFITANNTLVQQYARAIAPTGVPTDIVRKHAYELLSAVDGPVAYERVLNVMNKEMNAAIASPDAVRDMILGKRTDDPSADKGAGKTPFYNGTIIKYDKDGNRIK